MIKISESWLNNQSDAKKEVYVFMRYDTPVYFQTVKSGGMIEIRVIME